ncbi:hypothetical protein RclHR1_04320014 [Rhizophagus clarus]|uniref:Crinkler effector protein N-terminal domain-containing protein n=1 Tax=Rhizophagus clarus TaxID=94130 RepID=A0A2Z6RL71_9GLOM|nr:hypothetical protein RclHR1_04320014 [Rhizophagus clarus]
MDTSKHGMNTSKYPGYDALITYINKHEAWSWSYHGFFELCRNVIINSPPFLDNWDQINGIWSNRFLKAVKHYDQNISVDMEKKTTIENSEQRLKSYWKEVINEQRKNSIITQEQTNKNFELLSRKQQEKENLESLPSKRSRSNITLNCLVQGNLFKNAFPVDINKQQLIGHLKEVIKAKKTPDFDNISADKLILWKVNNQDGHNDELINFTFQNCDELLPMKKISTYFKKPAGEHIHIIISLPEFTETNQEQKLINQIAELQRLLNVSIYEFDIIVNPKRTKSFRWVANIKQATLKDLKKSIFAIYQTPELENDGAIITVTCNGEKYSPQNDLEFQNILQLFVSRNDFRFTVFVETSLSFSLWTFPKMCQFYKLGKDNDPSLSVFPPFNCECMELDDEKSQSIIKHLVTDLNFQFKAIPIGNEASKSQYVCAYLVAIANIFGNKFKVCPEKNISGPNGHGPVDFALVLIQTSKVFSITEVKDKDFQQECSLNDEGELKFKLSKPVVVVYGDKDMEGRVKTVIGNIAWLIEKIYELEELS